jgi:hypothetical protein
LSFNVPVIVCVFNRPALTRRLMAALADVRPDQLFIVADGPRSGNDRDGDLCRAAIAAIETGITWPCRKTWNVAATNLGCRRRIQTGLDWVFRHVEQAIILEDDCIPHPSFFPYCAELLDRYADDRRVGSIAGASPLVGRGLGGLALGAESYIFSRYPLSSGWATWRRMWGIYDPDIEAWPELRQTDWLADILCDPLATLYWRAIFDTTRDGFDAWDYQWTFSFWRSNALAIHPAANLVTHVGYGPDATHTRVRTPFAELPTTALPSPFRHPRDVKQNLDYDKTLESILFSGTRSELLAKVRQAIKTRAT